MGQSALLSRFGLFRNIFSNFQQFLTDHHLLGEFRTLVSADPFSHAITDGPPTGVPPTGGPLAGGPPRKIANKSSFFFSLDFWLVENVEI